MLINLKYSNFMGRPEGSVVWNNGNNKYKDRKIYFKNRSYKRRKLNLSKKKYKKYIFKKKETNKNMKNRNREKWKFGSLKLKKGSYERIPLKRWMIPLVTSTNGFPEMKLMLSGSSGEESLVDLNKIRVLKLFLFIEIIILFYFDIPLKKKECST